MDNVNDLVEIQIETGFVVYIEHYGVVVSTSATLRTYDEALQVKAKKECGLRSLYGYTARIAHVGW